MRMTRTLPVGRDTAIGIGIALICALVIGWALAGKPDPSARHYVVWAEFRDVSSLIRFDRDVRIAGVDVGTIGTVQRRGDVALVPLDLDPSLAGVVRADATAALRPHTLFDGNSFIELNPGSPAAPPLNGRVIPLSRTTNYVTVDKALRVLDTPTRSALQQLVGSLANTLRDPEVAAIRQTLRSMPSFTANLAVAARALQGPTGHELAGSIAGLSRTVSAIADGARNIGPTLIAASATAAAVNAADPSLSQALAVLPSALRASKAGSAALRATLTDLQPVAANLTPAMNQLAPALIELRPVLDEAGTVLGGAGPFLSSLHEVLSAASSAALPTTSLLRRLRPIIHTTASQVIPFLNAKTPDGSTNIQSMMALSAAAAGSISAVNRLGPAGSTSGSHDFYGLLTDGCSVSSSPLLALIFKQSGLCP